MDFGVVIPIGNNGWLIGENAPQYKPSCELDKRIVQEAEAQDFAVARSMIKLRGFGGKTEFRVHNLGSSTLMARLAAVTWRIKLYASTAVLTLLLALVARMSLLAATHAMQAALSTLKQTSSTAGAPMGDFDGFLQTIGLPELRADVANFAV